MRAPHEVDLNLLVVLHELLSAATVTEAARRLGRTQSAVSHSLRALRELFDDPLVVRAGASLAPTARAKELAPRVAELVDLARGMLGPGDAFDPARSRRRFLVAAADYGQCAVLPALLERLRREAPGVAIDVAYVGDRVDRLVQSGECDLALGAGFAPLSGLVQQQLFVERNVCVLRRDHPAARDGLDLDEFCRLGHVMVSPRGAERDHVDEALDAAGRARVVRARVPSFLAAPVLVAAGDLVTVVPARVARVFAGSPEVCAVEAPLPLRTFAFVQVFPEASRADPAHAWLRRAVAAACHDAPPPAGGEGAAGGGGRDAGPEAGPGGAR